MVNSSGRDVEMVGNLPEGRRVYSVASGPANRRKIPMFTPHALAPDPAALGRLCRLLESRAPETALAGPWQSGAFAALADAGCLAGFLPLDAGGTAATEPARLATLTAIAEACLTTALALSQWAAACRIVEGGDAATRLAWLPPLARGEAFTTVGISQLTTSRRHLGQAVLNASEDAAGWRLDGLCPWVTGADSVDTIVTGAATADGSQRFFVVETSADGLIVEPPMAMLALSGSRTSAVKLAGVRPAAVIVPTDGDGARTGGLATTALAIGATRASVAVIADEASRRDDLRPIADQLAADAESLAARLDEAARTGIDRQDRDRLRADANSLVVRAAQAALVACKGAGFVQGHPAEQLVREAMFFLVWSCPQAVTQAVICDLAGTA
jgi:alkylation response protein AidB-like acyl-CoA dehydrogenase